MSKKKHILVVEDDRDTRAQLGLLIELLGYETVLCADAEEGLKAFDAQSVDLVLTDLVLPHGDGVDLLTEIHKRNAELPVIILTGYPSEGSLRESLPLEPFAYLTKPISGEQIAQVLERAFAHKLTSRQNDLPAN